MSDFMTALRAANIARQKEWVAAGAIDLTYRGCELAGEAGEAANICKKIERERRGIPGSRATIRELADELADVLICVDLIAIDEGIDLRAALISKFNLTSRKMGLTTLLEETRP